MIDLENVDLATVQAVMATDKGTMVIGFQSEHAPEHVRNFCRLVQDGFYDGLAFHRVVKGFMIQGGCPNTREGATGVPGTGGPGYQIQAEFNDLPHKRGVLSMARSQNPDSAGSQFFVVHSEHAAFLDRQYTVFGQLEEGLDVLDEIATVEVEFGAGGERSKPVERIGVEKVELRIVEPEPDAPAEGTAEGTAEGPAEQAAEQSAEPSKQEAGAEEGAGASDRSEQTERGAGE